MSLRRIDAPITVWCGEYRFGRDDSFFPLVVRAGRKYADKEPDERLPESRFREELERLRGIAPVGGQVLVDQLEHRWRHPHCPPSLYVLTLTLCAPDAGALVADDGSHVQELLCTKVGEAMRTVAPRFPAYINQLLGGCKIAAGTQTLRLVIYGDGAAMLLEHEILEVAESIGSRARKIVDGEIKCVSDETYVGVEMIDALCAFARQRERAQRGSEPPE